MNVQTDDDPQKMVRRIWNGNYIRTLENGTKSNEIIKDIINVSLNHRVLSLYTAFLALEPWRMPQYSYEYDQGEKKDNNPTGVGEETTISTDFAVLKAFPNPFSEKINIEVGSLLSGTVVQSVNIYDVLGNRVKTININSTSSDLQLEWLGDDDLGNKLNDGLYIIVINTTSGAIKLKVVIQR